MVPRAISRVPQAAPMLHLGSFDFATQDQTKATLHGLWGAGVVQGLFLSWTFWSEEWMELVGKLVLLDPPHISQATVQQALTSGDARSMSKAIEPSFVHLLHHRHNRR